MNTSIQPHSATPHPLSQWLRRIGAFLQRTGIWIPILFLAFMFAQDPFSSAGDYDYDEGINLMKTALYEQNYPLYDVVWSDQPPFFTILLGKWFDIAGESTASARILVAIFSALLLWCFYLVTRRSVSAFAATGASLLLVLSQFYLRLSGAVMIGLPSLALALASITLLVRGKQRIWALLLSAVVMALALETKLFVAVLFPAIALHFWFGETLSSRRPWWQPLGRFVGWLLLTTVLFLAISAYFHALNLEMLIETHFGAQTQTQRLFVQGSQQFIADIFRQQPVYLLVAALGIVFACGQRRRAVILPLAWFLTVMFVFVFHRPLWYHHIMLLTIPMSWLAAFALEAWRQQLDKLAGQHFASRLLRSALLAGSAVALCLAILYYPSPLGQRLDEQSKLYRPLYIWEMVHQLSADAKAEPGFVFTDRPFYAFQADLPVTPPIAAISRKRMESGILTEEDMLDALIEYEPEYVILQRFTDDYSPAVMEEINEHYDLVLEIPPGRYYRRDEDS
ncbi:MAG: glycosyltransferase family 39 protein [Caldilineaceae bacterium]|nr:glycosyltransferase family 39 protein [Caldilineaceae bacterium]